MSIDTYGELKTAVANWLRRDDLTERIPEFIELGQSRLYTDLRCREVEATSNIATTASQQTDALPTRFVQARSLYVSGTPNVRLEYRSPVEFWSIYSSQTSAKPVVYTVEQENFVWGPTPDAIYTITVAHYAYPALFSADGDNNAVLTRWPGLFLYSALLEAAPFIGADQRIAVWATQYDTLIERVHAMDLKDRASGDAITQDRLMQVT